MRFGAEELADAHERGWAAGWESAIVRSGANLLSLAQEYRNAGRYEHAAAVVKAWECVCALTEAPHDG